jgi:hypothetical protein
MKTLLARQLQDDNHAIWTAAVKNDLLNRGLEFIETAILQHNPEAFLEVSTANMIYANDGYDDLYAKPIGLMSIKKVELKYAGETTYSEAKKLRNDQLIEFTEDAVSGVDEGFHWAPFGRWIRIFPVPTATSTAGIRLTFVPTLAMTVDADVPDIPSLMHIGIVYAARMMALSETDEDKAPEAMAALEKRLAIVLDRIPLYYSASHSEPDVFEVDIDHEAGWV